MCKPGKASNERWKEEWLKQIYKYIYISSLSDLPKVLLTFKTSFQRIKREKLELASLQALIKQGGY